MDGLQKFCGMVHRALLLQLLKCGQELGAFQDPSDSTELDEGHIMQYVDTAQESSRLSVGEVSEWLELADYDMQLDLSAYVNSSAFSVSECCTLRRAFLLFRTMGLRHLPVVNEDGCVRGIITRKDLILVDR